MIFASTLPSTIKKTLDAISLDTTDGYDADMIMSKFMTEETMDEAYVEEVEVAGPSLLAEKTEGGEIPFVGDTQEGTLKRYQARTYAGKMIITEEAMEDNQYRQSYDLAKMLKRVTYKTVDYTATSILARAESSSYPGADGVSLASASHPLANGSGTFSNTMATPLSPSVAALVLAQTAVFDFVGHDGYPANHKVKKIVFPNAQWAAWSRILKSEMTPTPGNYAEINVVKSDMDVELVRNPYWTNTTTNWCCITDCSRGLIWKWRRKPKGGSWVDNDNEVVKYKQSARWDLGWTNPRGVYFVGA